MLNMQRYGNSFAILKSQTTKIRKAAFFDVIVIVIFSSLPVLVFLYYFPFGIAINDFFYDGDSQRTILYAQDLRYSISTIRPLLPVFSIAPLLMAKIISSYSAWTCLNIFVMFFMITMGSKLFSSRSMKIFFVVLLVINFTSLVWIFVPETFLLAICFFLLTMLVYGDGNQRHRVFFSGLLSAILNIYLFVPWAIAHLLNRRNRLGIFVRDVIPVLTILFTLSLMMKFLGRYKLDDTSFAVTINNNKVMTSLPADVLPPDDVVINGFFSNFSSLAWLHMPVPGVTKNIIAFFTSPWMPSYRYQVGVNATDSVQYSTIMLGTAIMISILSFVGIWKRYNRFPIISNFCIALEISICGLFLAYGYHPYLFSPLLLVSRVIGLVLFIDYIPRSRRLLVMLVSFITCFAIQVVLQ
jgi:hypothetical protein